MAHVSLDNLITLSISVTNRKASAKWYNEMLGFELLYHADEMGWSELTTKTEGVTLGLGEQTAPSPGNCVPVFGVPDISTARDALEKAGVSFDGDTIEMPGMVKIATFFDPDNNALMLAQDLSK